MDLILWRHADAEDGVGKPDAERELTKKGRKQAERMAAWLDGKLDGGWLVLTSPAVRALQTVEPLGREFEVRQGLRTDVDARSVLREADWPGNSRNVVVVGHQPTLGEVAALLLGSPASGVSIKKGAIWWFSVQDGETVLRVVLDPDTIK